MNQLPAKIRGRLADVLGAGIGSAAPPYVSIKGGAFTLVDTNGDQRPIKSKHLDCIIIDALEWPSRVYWGDRAFDPTADSYQAPECFSDNHVGASRYAINPQSVRCDTCPQNVWGSAISKVSGKGIPACGSIKKIAVLAYLDGAKDQNNFYAGSLVVSAQDEPIPFLLRVPVMSLNNLKAFSAKFAGQSFDARNIVTRINFVHGEVGVIDFLPYASLDPDTEAEVTKILETDITDQLVGRNDQPVETLPGKATAVAKERLEPVVQPRTAEPQQIAPAATAKSGRGRPRKTAAAAGDPAGPPAAPQQPRTAMAELQPRTAPFASPAHTAPFASPSFPQNTAHGIVTNAGAPPHDVEKALDSLFNLKT